MRPARPPPWRAAAVLALAGLACGCAGGGGSHTRGATHGASASLASAPDTDEVRSRVMSLADSYSQLISQSLDALVESTADPKRAAWARGQRTAALNISVTNATAPDAMVGLLDMVVFATLKRAAIEEHWLPTLLGEEGEGVAEAYRRGEGVAWATAGRVLTESQVAELRGLIAAWQREHPKQYYVADTRFSDFDAYRKMTPDSPDAKTPGSLFSLLSADPLAGLDPVTRQFRNYRSAAERMAFRGSRFPILAAYQVDQAVNDTTGSAAFQSFVNGMAKFVVVYDRFATTMTDVPKVVASGRGARIKQFSDAASRGRQAAIEQSAKSVAAKREGVQRALQDQDGRIHSIINNLSGFAERAQQTGIAVNASTAQKVTASEAATRRSMEYAFRLVLIVILSALLGVPLVLLSWRLAHRSLMKTAGDGQCA